MASLRKLKRNEKAILLWLILGVLTIIVTFFRQLVSIESALGIWGFCVFINAPMSFVGYIRTRNIGFLFQFIFQISATLFALLAIWGGLDLQRPILVLLILCMLIFGPLGIYYAFSRKLKWRYREVLELAAAPVEDITDGYTDRPKPTGKAEYTQFEITSFANFLKKNLVVIPYFEKNRTVLSLAMTFRHRMSLRRDYADFTYLLFDQEENVSVHISKQDYLKYQHQLSFDQLCDSLAGQFIEFLELFKNGEGIRILDRMNALKLNPLSDWGESDL